MRLGIIVRFIDPYAALEDSCNLTRKAWINRHLFHLVNKRTGRIFARTWQQIEFVLYPSMHSWQNCQWCPSMDLHVHARAVIQSDRRSKMAHQFGTGSAFCGVCLECWPAGRRACSGITGSPRDGAKCTYVWGEGNYAHAHYTVTEPIFHRHVDVRICSRRMQMGWIFGGDRLQ